ISRPSSGSSPPRARSTEGTAMGDPAPDYEPLDISAACDVGLEVLAGVRQPALGRQLFHGIPFLIGDGSGSGRSFVSLDPGKPAVTIPIARRADRLIVAHRWLRRRPVEDDPDPGTEMATYTVHLDDGTIDVAPIRERIEIAAIAEEGWDMSGPFAAAGTSEISLLDRYEGRWEDIGLRQSETVFTSYPD